MLILLTNDDGIHAEGILVLRECLSRYHEVCVVAPERERTCVAHAITLHKPLRLREIEKGLLCSNGTPADCVLLGIQVVLDKKPGMVISGINMGPNMGQDVYYSGTVAGAREGIRLGVPSMAVSINARNGFRVGEAAQLVAKLVDIVSTNPPVPETFLNVNIPNIPSRDIRGFMVTRLGKRIYNDAVIERTDPRGNRYYWIGSNADGYQSIRGTDFYALDRACVSVTPLSTDGTPAALNAYKKILKRGL